MSRGPAAFAMLFACLWVSSTAAQQADGMTGRAWDSFWRRNDQRAADMMENRMYPEAAETFDDSAWKAAAHYRSGQYEQAISLLQEMDDVGAHYNRGNALARSGKIPEAIDAYENVLEQDSGHEDARHNLELLKQMQSQQSSDDQQNSQGGSRQSSNESGSEEPEDGSEEEPPAKPESDRAQEREEQTGDRQAQQKPEREGPEADEAQAQPESAEDQSELELATEQWLRRVPDDPAGLLRRKFRYQYQQRGGTDAAESQAW